MLAMAEPRGGPHDLIEHGLQPFGACDRAKHLADRLPLFAQVLVVPNELLDVARLVTLHAPDSTTGPPTRRTGWIAP